MKHILTGVCLIASALFLAGCEQSPEQHPSAPSHVNQSTSYGYRPAPRVYSRPTQYGKLPPRSEERSHTETVAGFPPGHPLHRDDSYDMPQSPYDQQSGDDLSSTSHPMNSSAAPMQNSTDLPHTNHNY